MPYKKCDLCGAIVTNCALFSCEALKRCSQGGALHSYGWQVTFRINRCTATALENNGSAGNSGPVKKKALTLGCRISGPYDGNQSIQEIKKHARRPGKT